ncbi:GTP cyclohydrolase II [Coprinopsis cinerea AmutBmut pab1-1]|nr:GTP cyclohydrolase II [Coprinopsis cinerea AmutBmut pab1-1]
MSTSSEPGVPIAIDRQDSTHSQTTATERSLDATEYFIQVQSPPVSEAGDAESLRLSEDGEVDEVQPHREETAAIKGEEVKFEEPPHEPAMPSARAGHARPLRHRSSSRFSAASLRSHRAHLYRASTLDRSSTWDLESLGEPFVAVDPYQKPNSKRARSTSLLTDRSKSDVEEEPWSTPVTYAPMTVPHVRKGTLGSVYEEETRILSRESLHSREPFIPHPIRRSSRQFHRSPSPGHFHDVSDTEGEDEVFEPVRFENLPASLNFYDDAYATRYQHNHNHFIQKRYSPGSNDTIDELPLHNASTAISSLPGNDATKLDWLKYILRTVYLYVLLGLPSLYFSRVAAIFSDASLDILLMKQLTLDSASTRRLDLYGTPPSPRYSKLKRSWHHFIDSLIKEWKTLNIVSVLLLSAILALLQIESANADPWVHYAALCSLICALVSLLMGCMYIIRFNTMRKTYKAVAWAQELKRDHVGLLWNVWILLALPVVWLAWSLIFYVKCIVVYMWRGDLENPPKPFSAQATLAIRCTISCTLGIAVVYGGIVTKTFIGFGAPMDRRFNEQVEDWMRRKAIFKHSDENFHPGAWNEGLHKREPKVSVVPVTSSDASTTLRPGMARRLSSRSERQLNQKVRFDVPASPSTSPSTLPSTATFVEESVPPTFGRGLSSSPVPLYPDRAESPPPQRRKPRPMAPNIPLSHESSSLAHSQSTSSHSPTPRTPVRSLPTLPLDDSQPPSQSRESSERMNQDPVTEDPVVVLLSDPEYASFLGHSPHPIQYGDHIYPTMAHLFEAMKFMEQYPELVQQIRECQHVEMAFQLSREF